MEAHMKKNNKLFLSLLIFVSIFFQNQISAMDGKKALVVAGCTALVAAATCVAAHCFLPKERPQQVALIHSLDEPACSDSENPEEERKDPRQHDEFAAQAEVPLCRRAGRIFRHPNPCATFEDEMACVSEIISSNPRLGVTPLMFCAGTGRTDLVAQLIEQGADINEQSPIGWTPLTHAAFNNHVETMTFLLDFGADVNGHNSAAAAETCITPLIIAARNNQLSAVELLVSRGSDISLVDIHGKTALELALEYEKTEVTQYLAQYA